MGMVGEQIPIVMIPRFTSYVGTSEFVTVALDVSAYARGDLTLWRGKLIGSGATFELFTESSHDGNNWFGYPEGPGGQPIPWDPGADASEIVGIDVTRRYFRVRVVLSGTDPGVTVWCAGTLEARIEN